jgi:nucleoid-associated protein YgaU
MQAIEFTGARSAGSRPRLVAMVSYIVMFALITAASIAFAWSRIPDLSESQLGEYRQVVVQPGDTLWDLAREHSPEGADIRRIVYEIRTLNGLAGAEIHPGQHLLLPVAAGSRQ